MTSLAVSDNWQSVKQSMRDTKRLERRRLVADFHADAQLHLFDVHSDLTSFAWAQHHDRGEFRCCIDTDQICVNGLNPIAREWMAASVKRAQEAVAYFLLCVGEDALRYMFGPDKFIRILPGEQAEIAPFRR